jgi:hypothetical protein
MPKTLTSVKDWITLPGSAKKHSPPPAGGGKALRGPSRGAWAISPRRGSGACSRTCARPPRVGRADLGRLCDRCDRDPPTIGGTMPPNPSRSRICGRRSRPLELHGTAASGITVTKAGRRRLAAIEVKSGARPRCTPLRCTPQRRCSPLRSSRSALCRTTTLRRSRSRAHGSSYPRAGRPARAGRGHLPDLGAAVPRAPGDQRSCVRSRRSCGR